MWGHILMCLIVHVQQTRAARPCCRQILRAQSTRLIDTIAVWVGAATLSGNGGGGTDVRGHASGAPPTRKRGSVASVQVTDVRQTLRHAESVR